MCFLKAYSKTCSFSKFSELTLLPVFSVKEKGDSNGVIRKEYSISFDVSDREWDRFTEQAQDAIAFLKKWHRELVDFLTDYEVDEIVLDFPVYSSIGDGSRLDNIANQNLHFPRELVSLAGSLNIGLEIGLYAKELKKAFGDSK